MQRVSIIGKPNVGKSTLFNRLAGVRISITNSQAGVTRDILEKKIEWNRKTFLLTDTGGIDFDETSNIPFINYIREKAIDTMKKSSVILFIVDGKSELSSLDFEIKDFIIKSGNISKTILVINKMESYSEDEIYKFYELGIEKFFIISAMHGANTGDLLDAVIEYLPEDSEPDEAEDIIKISIIGKPNVGKSSLTNLLLGQQRMIVSEISGTTRDAVDSKFRYNKKDYLIVDTPGVRRKKSINDALEKYSVNRAIRSIKKSDVILHLISAVDNISDQDIKLISLVKKFGKCLIFLVNKWDLIDKNNFTFDNYKKELFYNAPYLENVPILFISVLTKQRTSKIMETVNQVYENYTKKISTAKLNQFLLDFKTKHRPVTKDKRDLNLKYIFQLFTKPPFFVVMTSSKSKLRESYIRLFTKSLSEFFEFSGVPIKIKFKPESKK